MRMRLKHLANGDLLLMYVYVDNYVFRQARDGTYFGGVISFVDILMHKITISVCVTTDVI